MMLTTPPQPPQGNTLEDTDLKGFVKRYLRLWPHVLLSFVGLMAITILLVIVVPASYTASMSLLIETPMRYDDPNLMVQPLQRGAEPTHNNYYINEKLLITSQPVVRKAVERLGLTIQYLEGGILDRDIYKASPILVQVDSTRMPRPTHFPVGIPFYVDVIDGTSFALEGEGEYGPDEREICVEETKQWGEWFELDSVRVKVSLIPGKANDLELLKETTYGFMLRDPHTVTLELLGELEPEMVEAEASTVVVNLTGSPNQKIVDVLNAIGYTYVERHMDERRMYMDRTIRHMEDEMVRNSTSLSVSSDSVEAFRTAEGIAHLSHETILLLERSADLERERQELMVKDQYYRYLEDLLSKGTNDKPMSPKAFGIQDEILNEMTERLVTLQTDIRLLEAEGKTANPNYLRMKRQMDQQRENILGSVQGFKASNDLRLKNVNERFARMQSQQSAVPRTERALSDKQRDQRVLEALHTDLALRSSNLRITRQALEPEVKLSTPAYITSTEPVFPNIKIMTIIAVLLSFIIPLGYLVVAGLLGDKVHSERDIAKALPGARVVAHVPYTALTEGSALLAHDRSRTYTEVAKLASFLEHAGTGGTSRTMVCGADKREGARTVAMLLATMLAHRGHRTALIDAAPAPRKKPSYPVVPGLEVLQPNADPGDRFDHVITLGPSADRLATVRGIAERQHRVLLVCEAGRTAGASVRQVAELRDNGQIGTVHVVMNRDMGTAIPFFGFGRTKGDKRLGFWSAVRYNWARAV